MNDQLGYIGQSIPYFWVKCEPFYNPLKSSEAHEHTWVVNPRSLPLSLIVGVLDFLHHIISKIRSCIKNDFQSNMFSVKAPCASMAPCKLDLGSLVASIIRSLPHPSCQAMKPSVCFRKFVIQ